MKFIFYPFIYTCKVTAGLLQATFFTALLLIRITGSIFGLSKWDLALDSFKAIFSSLSPIFNPVVDLLTWIGVIIPAVEPKQAVEPTKNSLLETLTSFINNKTFDENNRTQLDTSLNSYEKNQNIPALHHAINIQDEKVCDIVMSKLLDSRKFYIEQPDPLSNDDTALIKAVRNKHLKAIELLLDNGANLLTTNKLGETAFSIALDEAVNESKNQAIKTILAHNITRNIADELHKALSLFKKHHLEAIPRNIDGNKKLQQFGDIQQSLNKLTGIEHAPGCEVDIRPVLSLPPYLKKPQTTIF
jgi:hypothetical protein